MTDIIPVGDPGEIAALPPELRALFEAGTDETGQDFENTDNDASIPRIRLMQALSPEVTSGKFSPGQVVDPDLGYVYLKNPKSDAMEFIPLYTYKTRVYFKPRSEGGDMSCRSEDYLHGMGEPGGECMACSYSQWDGDRPPRCTEQQNVVMYFPGAPRANRVGVATFMKTQFKVARELIRKIRSNSNGRRMFTSAYSLGVFMDKSGSDTFYNWQVETFDGGSVGKLVTDPQILSEAMALADGIRETRQRACENIAKRFSQQTRIESSVVTDVEQDEELDIEI